MGVQSIFVVWCPCRQSIALPPQSPLGIFRPPEPRPNLNKWPANFVCTDCEQWFSRLAEETHLIENASLVVQSLTGNGFWQVEFVCNHRDCGQCIPTYITLPLSSSASGIAAYVRASSGLKCPEHGLLLLREEPTLVKWYPYLFLQV